MNEELKNEELKLDELEKVSGGFDVKGDEHEIQTTGKAVMPIGGDDGDDGGDGRNPRTNPRRRQ